MVNNNRKLIITGLMTAMVFVLTFLIKVPVPFTSGYIHLGDSMIYISVMLLGPVPGAFASGVGSMLADIIGGYPQYAIPTLIIKSLMALLMGMILSGKTRKSVIGSVAASILVWVGFISGALIYINDQLKRMGQEKLIEMIAGPDADAAAIEHTTGVLENLPLYLTVGMVLLILILILAAYFMTKRNGGSVFSLKAVIGMTAAGMLMVMGYFLVESFMYSPVAAIFSVPMNMIQFFSGVAAASLFAPAIKKAGLSVEK